MSGKNGWQIGVIQFARAYWIFLVLIQLVSTLIALVSLYHQFFLLYHYNLSSVARMEPNEMINGLIDTCNV